MTSLSPPSPTIVADLPTYVIEAPAADKERLANAEWLIPNGLGGFAMGTALGVPTRRYHALLNAAATPPVGRISTLHSLADRVVLSPGTPGERAFDLCAFSFAHEPGRFHPEGFANLVSFEHEPAAASCQWTYRVGEGSSETEIIRELTLSHGCNAACVRYFIRATDTHPSRLPFRLEARPLVAIRDFHALRRRSAFDRFQTQAGTDGATLTLDTHRLVLESSGGMFRPEPQWWYDFFYAEEARRGLDSVEDLYSPGVFTVDIDAGRGTGVMPVLTLFARFDNAPAFNPETTQHDRRAHIRALVTHAAGIHRHDDDRTIAALVTAADAFVVRRDFVGGANGTQPPQEHGSSIIAGYPWFSDWGRDACISLPGLLLTTGRFDEARRVLLAFAGLRRRGIIPNCFADQSGEAEYNTVDASLWFVHACCEYARRGSSDDAAAFTETLAPACLDILDWYRRGTDHQIGMDPEDFLIAAGTSHTQLTWMDARRDGVTFTPRHGKPVEINALWHSALLELAGVMTDLKTEPSRAADLRDLGAAVARSFRAAFWNAQGNCLFDRLTPPQAGASAGSAWTPVAEMRPNQLLAVSLPHSPLTREQQQGVLAAVRDRLLTPVGVRTLAPDSPGYEARYEGPIFVRDRAYHNGTAWPWLLGSYAEGVLRAGGFSAESRRGALDAITPLIRTLTDTGSLDLSQRTPLGSVAEVYDAEGTPEMPQRADGCPMQAWSIAELLRVYLLAHAPRG